MDSIFTGFSTSGKPSSKRAWVLHDRELIKQDLLNYFYTKKGERVMRPTFGSNLWEYIMEPNTETVRDEIYAEVRRVVALDPRLTVGDVKLFTSEYKITVAVELYYRPFNTSEVLKLEFDRRQT